MPSSPAWRADDLEGRGGEPFGERRGRPGRRTPAPPSRKLTRGSNPWTGPASTKRRYVAAPEAAAAAHRPPPPRPALPTPSRAGAETAPLSDGAVLDRVLVGTCGRCEVGDADRTPTQRRRAHQSSPMRAPASSEVGSFPRARASASAARSGGSVRCTPGTSGPGARRGRDPAGTPRCPPGSPCPGSRAAPRWCRGAGATLRVRPRLPS